MMGMLRWYAPLRRGLLVAFYHVYRIKSGIEKSGSTPCTLNQSSPSS